MHEVLLDMLICPQCGGELRWMISARRQHQVETGQARCLTCDAAYPVEESIGVFLTPDRPREDLWRQVESGLAGYLRQNPGVERRLLGVPIEALGSADQFFRAMILEERGAYEAAQAAFQQAQSGLYTHETLACKEQQLRSVLDCLA